MIKSYQRNCRKKNKEFYRRMYVFNNSTKEIVRQIQFKQIKI